jgi:hypothetical protein
MIREFGVYAEAPVSAFVTPKCSRPLHELLDVLGWEVVFLVYGTIRSSIL